MRKSLIAVVVVVAGLSSLSMSRNPAMDLLDTQDYERMTSDLGHGPALSAPMDGSTYWASYNQWLCFPTRNIDLSCREVEYRGLRKVPALHITEDSHDFEFSMDPEPAPDCEKIVRKWKALLQDEEAVCLYAAPLQELNVSDFETSASSASLWILNQLKTVKGYWSFESDENWITDEIGDVESREGSNEP